MYNLHSFADVFDKIPYDYSVSATYGDNGSSYTVLR